MLTEKTPSAFSRLILGIAFLSIFVIFTRTPSDADMWWHLRAGEEMIARGEILLQDIFSYTRAGFPWVNAFWLADIIIYLVFKAGSYLALAAFVSLIGVATFWVASRELCIPAFWHALLLVLAALTASPIWTPRPQLFSFFLLAFLDFWLSQLKRGEKENFWLLIPLFALWANLHGGYIWGILLLIAVLVGELFNHFLGNQAKNDNFFTPAALKKLAIFSGLALFAVLLNPSGLELWRLPFHTVDVSLSIQEWRSPDFHQISFHPLLWMLFLFILALGASGKRIDYNDLFKVLGFAYLTFVSQRNIAPFSIILLPVLSRHLSFAWDVWRMSPFGKFLGRWRINFSSRQLPVYLTRSINSLLVLLVGLIAITNLYLQTRPYKIEEAYPFDAVQWIKDTQPDGHLFNSYNWGGYLIWELRDYPVFIDGRADLYGDEIIYQWRQILAGGEKAQELLNKWGINLILVESNWRQADVLPQYGWKLLYQDKLSVIYGR